MRWAKALALSLLLSLGSMGVAHASTSTVWDGNGAENLPCADGGHWVLSPAQGVTSAVLTVNGVSYTMTQNGQGSFAADSTGPLDSTLTASATYEGDNDTAFLKLSHCTDSGPTESPTPTPTESPSPTDSPTPPPSTSSSPPTSPPTHSHSHTPTQHPTQPASHGGKHHPATAYTGSHAALPAIAGGILGCLGLAALWFARRRVT